MVIYVRGVVRETVERAVILEVLEGGVRRFG